jgi:hypothetical protein
MMPVPHPQVISRAVGDGSILFHSADEVYFGLNRVGARVWELLPAVESMDELTAAISAEYPDAPADSVRADVAELLEQLAAQGLVRTGPSSAD